MEGFVAEDPFLTGLMLRKITIFKLQFSVSTKYIMYFRYLIPYYDRCSKKHTYIVFFYYLYIMQNSQTLEGQLPVLVLLAAFWVPLLWPDVDL